MILYFYHFVIIVVIANLIMMSVIIYLSFFFFKHKTAYEMRISDWSSDVCSSDLMCRRHYEEGDERVLPRTIASFEAFENAMSLDIAMGGSTNTVLHLLAAAHEAGVDFTMEDIDRLSRRVPCLSQDRKSGA